MSRNAEKFVVPPIIELYQRAWEKQEIALLKDIFTPDAEYIFRPIEIAPPLRGLVQIEQYWRDWVQGEQESVKFEVLRWIESCNELWFEWKASIVMPMLRPGNDIFPLWGTIILDLSDIGKIRRLTEYYFWDNEQRVRLNEIRRRSK